MYITQKSNKKVTSYLTWGTLLWKSEPCVWMGLGALWNLSVYKIPFTKKKTTHTYDKSFFTYSTLQLCEVDYMHCKDMVFSTIYIFVCDLETYPREVHLSLRTKNHVRSQHILEYPYIQVSFCKKK